MYMTASLLLETFSQVNFGRFFYRKVMVCHCVFLDLVISKYVYISTEVNDYESYIVLSIANISVFPPTF